MGKYIPFHDPDSELVSIFDPLNITFNYTVLYVDYYANTQDIYTYSNLELPTIDGKYFGGWYTTYSLNGIFADRVMHRENIIVYGEYSESNE